MKKLVTEFTDDEIEILTQWDDKNMKIFEEFEMECYSLNQVSGKYHYEECFGKSQNDNIGNWKLNKISPRRVIKFYEYFIIENDSVSKWWYIGEIEKNDTILCLSGAENLSDAFESL